jgi:malate synthase
VLADGRKVSVELFRGLLQDETQRLAGQLGPDAYAQSHLRAAADILDEMTSAATCADFLTLIAYPQL